MRITIVAGIVLAGCSVQAAFAKDLPRGAAQPRTSGCEWAGPGFAKIEGSNTCVKVGGSMRAEFSTSTSPGSAFLSNLGK